jgi:8-oxo-dGTP diphosphatase
MSKNRFTMTPAVFIIVEKNNEILLLRRSNTGYADGMYTLPAGHVEAGESIIQSAVRELKEETGLHVDEANMSIDHIMYRNTDRSSIYFFLKATKYTGDVENRESEKHDELLWVKKSHFPENMLEYILVAMKKGNDNIYFSEYHEGEF